MQNDTLDALHRVHLEALLEIDRICRKHGIGYFIIAGTLLGAVRHGGFIPWDDDLDIGMMRGEYERFLQVAPRELAERYFLQTWRDDPGYFFPYAKVRVNNTRFVEHISRLAPCHQGIFVDVFPFDNAPDSPLWRRLHHSLTKMLRVAALARSAYDPPQGALRHGTYKVLQVVTRLLPLAFWMSLEQWGMRLCRNGHSRDVVNIGGAYGYRRECLPRAFFQELADIPFEGVPICSPKRFHEYLSTFYGDYMTPPPPDKRYNRHGVDELCFDCSAEEHK